MGWLVRRLCGAHSTQPVVRGLVANVREAQNAESKDDFIHKFKIAAKECEETLYWLELCKFKTDLPDCTHLLNQIIHIKNILNKIIITSKNKIMRQFENKTMRQFCLPTILHRPIV